ncbi:hypothetical protein [Streptomyces sp. NPDC021096]|uniref:hypothetical protein n=1 Tax=Streptomyces sp. NPDC021096 TaxID=3154792 RepID=UPI003407F9CF
MWTAKPFPAILLRVTMRRGGWKEVRVVSAIEDIGPVDTRAAQKMAVRLAGSTEQATATWAAAGLPPEGFLEAQGLRAVFEDSAG